MQGLLREPVRPLARVVLAGLDREAHLLAECSADESADAVVLPAEEIAGSPGSEAMRPQFTIQAVSTSATPAAEAARRRSSSNVASGKPSRIASSR